MGGSLLVVRGGVEATAAGKRLMDSAKRACGLGGARLAATVLLVRDGPGGVEVWVQERVSTMEHYPGMTVFPGGGVDERDWPQEFGSLWSGPSIVATARALGTSRHKAHALVFAAVRELFEETGTLLAIDATGATVEDASPFHGDRLALESHRLALTQVLQRGQLRVRSDLLRPWARWVGPSERGTWFDTFSFLAVRPRGQEPDGQTPEALSAGWFPPGLILQAWRHGLVRLVVSTWHQLLLLERCATVDEALARAAVADMTPVILPATGDDPRFDDYYRNHPTDRR